MKSHPFHHPHGVQAHSPSALPYTGRTQGIPGETRGLEMHVAVAVCVDDQWIHESYTLVDCLIKGAILNGDIPLHRPYIGLIYGRYLQSRTLKWPLIYYLIY
jgi:hypothetical protein